MDNDALLLLGRIDGKLDSLIKAVNGHIQEDEERFTNVHTRLENVETERTYQAGRIAGIRWVSHSIAAVVGGVTSVLVSFFRS